MKRLGLAICSGLVFLGCPSGSSPPTLDFDVSGDFAYDMEQISGDAAVETAQPEGVSTPDEGLPDQGQIEDKYGFDDALQPDVAQPGGEDVFSDQGQAPDEAPSVPDEGVAELFEPGPDAISDQGGQDIGQVQCFSDEDCFELGEPSQCHAFACIEGACEEIPEEDGVFCEDGDLCTGPDFCSDGKCISGQPIQCDDQNPCTLDSCDPAVGCVHLPDTSLISCGVGECFRQIPKCVNGVLQTCVPGLPMPEVCDGRDNDCDGETDETYPEIGKTCQTGLPGVCSSGTYSCEEGALVCNPITPPGPERCDGLDNDCDGEVDEGNPDGGLPCLTGLMGVCAIGKTVCLEGFIVCVQNILPSAEVCDGLDNDCDGEVDEGDPGGGVPCDTGKPGVCKNGLTRCVNGNLQCIQNVQPSDEVCDGLDNDCDGLVDPPGSAGCSQFWADRDGDGYGDSQDLLCLCAASTPYTATKAGDCCDLDERAHPGVTSFHTAPNSCGSFDYNCDGNLTLQHNYLQGSCSPWPSCNPTQGWLGNAPSCGETGNLLLNCRFGLFGCVQTVQSVTQGCY